MIENSPSKTYLTLDISFSLKSFSRTLLPWNQTLIPHEVK